MEGKGKKQVGKGWWGVDTEYMSEWRVTKVIKGLLSNVG